MGIFSGLMGNASQMDTDKVENQLSDILISDEQVDLAYTLIRDLIVFTNYRLILVDKQGVTGKKVSY
ncbi:TPA: PH domain-containing protein, partial [Streptococcus agalactiae]